MEERPSYYSIIPACVRYDHDLKANEKLIYGEVTALCDNLGYCWATNDYFAQLYQVSKETVSRWINNLVKKGYLHSEIIYKENSSEILNRILKIDKNLDINISNLYRKRDVFPIDDFINRVSTEKSRDHCQNNQMGIDKKVKENNTSINNNSTTTNTEKNIFEVIEENFGRTLNPIEYETINKWGEYNFPLELLKYAVEKAVLKNIYAIGYIDKILYEWDKNNIRTVVQAQKDDEKHAEKKNQSKKPYQQHETKYQRMLRESQEYDKMEALKNE